MSVCTKSSFLKKKAKKIYILSLGGTLSSLVNNIINDSYGRPNISIEQVVAGLPLKKDEVQIISEQFLQQISHEMTNEQLIAVAKKINEILERDDIDGLVVTQGTNSIEETSYFVNLVVNTKKPIVFTGAFRPFNSLGYDGYRNLFNAILIASAEQLVGRGVLLCFNDNAISSREGSKVSVLNQYNFSHSGEGVLGHIRGGNLFVHRSPQHKHTYLSDFTIKQIRYIPSIFILYGHLGLDLKLIETILKTDIKGIISVGSGGGYQSKAVFELLGTANRQGITVVRCSRVASETVIRDYKIDDRHNFIAGNSLNPQKARVLLAVALNKTTNNKELQDIFDQY